jgi:hypothetical protein
VPATTLLIECRQFADEIQQAGGVVPDVLQRLLDAADVLTAPAPAEDPLRGILDQALNRQVPDGSEIDALIAEAAVAQSVADYRAGLAPRVERVVVERWHKTLRDGAADLVLTSLRKSFDTHAKAIGVARELIPRETELTQWLATAKPEAVTAWQGLGDHITALTAIGNIAAAFGARPLARFSLIKEIPGDNYATSDVALYCCCGGLVGDSAPFLAIDRGHRASAWMAVPLRLNSVAQAKERYRAWCEGEWSKIHATTTVQYTNPVDGSVSELELKNPYNTKVST